MLKNYFKIALRNAMRQKGYSAINILGLAIGIASCLLILQYVSYELSFENFQSALWTGVLPVYYFSDIGCLFGLASFTTLQCTKEIGIRKAMGASVTSILHLLYREFSLLLCISFLVAAPLAWLSTSSWLQGYAFRISMQWYYFVLPFMIIIAIALLTVSFQSIKAALANPVKSLRSE